VIRLPRPIVNEVLDHVRADPGREVCGLIGARDGIAVRCLSVPNVAADPANRYRMDPARLIEGLYAIEGAGETLLAVWHSHPRGPARPSAIDIAEATFPAAIYLIVSLDTRGVMEMRGFRIAAGTTEEVGLELI